MHKLNKEIFKMSLLRRRRNNESLFGLPPVDHSGVEYLGAEEEKSEPVEDESAEWKQTVAEIEGMSVEELEQEAREEVASGDEERDGLEASAYYNRAAALAALATSKAFREIRDIQRV